MLGDVERELRQVRLAGHVDDPHRHAVDVARRGRLERAHDEGDQVRGHDHGGRRTAPPCGPAPTGASSTTGAFEYALQPGSSTTSVISKTALRSGSSKQGKARRASVDSIWLVAMVRLVPDASTKVLR